MNIDYDQSDVEAAGGWRELMATRTGGMIKGYSWPTNDDGRRLEEIEELDQEEVEDMITNSGKFEDAEVKDLVTKVCMRAIFTCIKRG